MAHGPRPTAVTARDTRTDRRRAIVGDDLGRQVALLIEPNVAINEWWIDNPAERYWMEITDRSDLGYPSIVGDGARREGRRDALDPLLTELAHGLAARVAVRDRGFWQHNVELCSMLCCQNGFE